MQIELFFGLIFKQISCGDFQVKYRFKDKNHFTSNWLEEIKESIVVNDNNDIYNYNNDSQHDYRIEHNLCKHCTYIEFYTNKTNNKFCVFCGKPFTHREEHFCCLDCAKKFHICSSCGSKMD